MWHTPILLSLFAATLFGAKADDLNVERITAQRSLAAPDHLVDLGYALYKGYHDAGTDLNVWLGIRYAAPPRGALRWKAPQTPETDRSVQDASEYGSVCFQSYPAIAGAPPMPEGDEDCLFLNVYAPSGPRAKKLPVLMWIHGGGYGWGDGRTDMSAMINDNDNAFIGVSIQYRLGPYGFLSSSEVNAKGVPNAGLLDIAFALEWIEKHIHRFGGDNTRITVSGESAGAGAVLLLSLAPSLKSKFQSIAASPYLPGQHAYDGDVPTQKYYSFAAQAGCGSSGPVLDCLRAKDAAVLQLANFNVTTSGKVYRTWAFDPVTDGTFTTGLPSKMLSSSRTKLNGRAILVGTNANEGALFVPQDEISTLEDLKAWLALKYPFFSAQDVEKVLAMYPNTDAPDDPSAAKFATNGLTGAANTNMSQVATGHLQRANAIIGEATFICPSYWLSTAYTASSRPSFHYQYSVPFAAHLEDVYAYFGPNQPQQPPSFSRAFRNIWGNFVTRGDPSVAGEPGLDSWPRWKEGREAQMVNLNTTGGTAYTATTQFGVQVTQFEEPGVRNQFGVVGAWGWEGGRGERCEVWRELVGSVPT
ncbi:alpha/beta-hydrolase [Paraphaeosphaeria sporulosa]|uniref:Carboxylic ester hydrolase n=1 Tax=Paraphaeosphaeria sporulosa TaxID=1460663 RepID=A0A177D1V1_9PLEO|nr:alpha/beta-hydrolase [Paraphaeosphaeria sporulosa]OAG13110.1 alpha/beta-hydrolase [Paraphaeosphaeria sporulosa]